MSIRVKELRKWYENYARSREHNVDIIGTCIEAISSDLDISTVRRETVAANWKTGSQKLGIRFFFKEFINFLKILYRVKHNFRKSKIVLFDPSRLISQTRDALISYIKPLEYISTGNQTALILCKPSLSESSVNDKERTITIGYGFFISQMIWNSYKLPYIIALWIAGSIGKSFSIKFLKVMLLEDAIRSSFRSIELREVLMLTSNSYFCELVRFVGRTSRDSVSVLEILHGVPSPEIVQYHIGCREIGRATRVKFISSVPEIRQALSETGIGIIENYPVNLTINKLYQKFSAWSQIDSMVKNSIKSENNLSVVAINGGADNSVNYLDSVQFQIENKLIHLVKEWAKERGCEVEIIYTIHPIHIKTGHDNEIRKYFSNDVVIFDQSFFSWLMSDLVIAIYSGAVWDAQFMGARTFLPIRNNGIVYHPNLLMSIGHVDEYETVKSALLRQLESITPQTCMAIMKRAQERYYKRKTNS